MLRLYAYFPYLSIEVVNRPIARNNSAISNEVNHTSENDDFTLIEATPLVVSDGPELRPIVYAVNRAAFECGIRIGMTLASAKVLHHDLIALPRDTTRELRALKRIANFLLQFTPSVAIDEAIDRAGIVIEISGSLTLFGGFDALLARVRDGIRAMRYVARYGAAPTPLAASVLARAAKRRDDARTCFSKGALQDTLAPLSVKHFAWSNATFRALDTLGLATIGDVLRQPYAGLQKRFGHALVHDLDCALGRVNDVWSLYIPPERFESRIDFLFEIKDTDRLLPPIEELLIELEGFLRARGAGATHIALELKQGRSQSQHFEFHSRAPVRNAAHWLRLVCDRIETHELDAPTIEIVLRVERIVPLIEENTSLLPQERGTRSDWFTLLDRLASRLGGENVYRIESIDDHRPELAWRSERDEANKPSSNRASKVRPTWLLREPKSLIEMEGHPQYNGALSLLAGPERIDTGWWDNKPVARDYFVAVNPAREVCWVFRDYRQGHKWYLHGFFS
jgi:protein ImuB